MIRVDSYLYRGARPGKAGLVGFASALDLESGAQVWGDASPLQEALEGEEVDCRVYPHPLSGIWPPSVAQLTEAVNFLARQQELGIKTLVHCAHGHERTGMVVAAYRILRQGWTPRKAAAEALEMGLHYVYLPWVLQLWRL